MLKYDSVHGRFEGGEVASISSTLIVNGGRRSASRRARPANLKWNEVGLRIVIRSSACSWTKGQSAEALSPPAPKC